MYVNSCIPIIHVCMDTKHSPDCPFELADNQLAIAIVDYDDFKMYTLTGAGQANRNNVMYVQSESLNKNVPSQNYAHERICQ